MLSESTFRLPGRNGSSQKTAARLDQIFATTFRVSIPMADSQIFMTSVEKGRTDGKHVYLSCIDLNLL